MRIQQPISFSCVTQYKYEFDDDEEMMYKSKNENIEYEIDELLANGSINSHINQYD